MRFTKAFSVRFLIEMNWGKHLNCSRALHILVLCTSRVKEISCEYCNSTYWKHSTKKPVTTMLTYPWKCTVVHCNHLGNTWKPLVLMTLHFDYCPSASEGDHQSVRSSAPVVSRCFPGGYSVKLYISRGRLAWWLLTFLHSENEQSYEMHFPLCPVILCLPFNMFNAK